MRSLRQLLLSLLLSIPLFAENTPQTSSLQNPVDYRVMQLLGVEDYKVNQKFIQRLFSNQAYFLESNGQPDLYKITKTLKQNGLLKLTFSKPMELEIAFVISDNAQTFISTLYDILDAMGYYYFLVKQSVLDDKQFKFILLMNTEYAIDPTLLQEKLKEYGYKVQSIERTNLNQWNYSILLENFQYPKATLLQTNTKNHKADLKGEYWYQIDSGRSLEVNSSNGTLWYPKIIFFDHSLNVLQIISHSKSTQRIVQEIPKNTRFIKITDTYLPITTKNGLDVILQ